METAGNVLSSLNAYQDHGTYAGLHSMLRVKKNIRGTRGKLAGL